MITNESRLESKNLETLRGYIHEEKYINGYFLTISDLEKLVEDYERDKQTDNMIGLSVNTISYLERWLKNHNRIEKKD
jgi:hypothetical protein